jgi:DNA polymerase III alpha subunit
MIAFEALKTSSAIKLYMGANNEPAKIQDEVSKQLQKYDEKLKYCETDEDREEVDIKDYISEEYLHYVDDSKKYQGIIISKKAHACGHILLNGDIREEIGLFRCESKTSKKSVLTACIDGTMADHYKYLKTDLLIVDVVGLTEAIWERIGKKSITNNELEKILGCDQGSKAWEIYSKGYTLCVNQCEKEGTKNKCIKYKMQNTAELSAFVAGIRPGFRSLINNFLARKPYTTNVPQLDEILKDSYSYMLYQESIMAFLNWLGIDMKETYDIVKKISKKIFIKHPEQMEELKNKVRPQWIKNTGSEEYFDETFQIVNDAGSYAFNSAHSYCVGNDGAEIAYLKAYYPYETYEVCLNWFNNKNNKNKVALLKQEMKEAFDINEGDLKWGLDNRQYTYDKDNKCIHPCLSSIKGMGKDVANELYDLYTNNKYESFFDLLIDIKGKTSVDDSMLNTLIKLRYFSNFGKSQKLINIVNVYNKFYKKEKGIIIAKKQFKKEGLGDEMLSLLRKYSDNETEKTFTKVNVKELVKEIISNIPDKEILIKEILITEMESLGYISYRNEKYKSNIVAVTNIKINGWGTPFVDLYCINSGKSLNIKVDKKYFNEKPLSEYEMIAIVDIKEKPKKRQIDGKWTVLDEKELILNSYSRIIIDEVETDER